jgi:hypothetical protein
VRHRATRPAFTVEVKRRRSKSLHPFTTAEGHPHESLPKEGLLTSFRHGPLARSSVDWGELIERSPSQESTPSMPKTPAAGPSAKLRTGRILPDVLGAQLAAQRIQPELEERAGEDRATRRTANRDARPRQPTAEARKVAKPISSARTTWTAEVFPAPLAEISEPPPADVLPVVGGSAASTMISEGSLSEAAGHRHERSKDKRVPSSPHRRAKRRGLPIPPRRSERWKRRLPRACW